MDKFEARVWGFDLRVRGADHQRSDDWLRSVDRLGCFTLKPRSAHLYSVDSSIWPSAFLYPEPLSIEHLEEPARAAYREASQSAEELWNDLATMKAFARAQGRDGTCIAVEACLPPGATVDEVASDRLFVDCVPDRIPDSFRLLGFDIADAACFSGYLNCGYCEEDRAVLLPKWSEAINEAGLLATLDAAMGFCRDTEERTPRHGPFFVFAIYCEDLVA